MLKKSIIILALMLVLASCSPKENSSSVSEGSSKPGESSSESSNNSENNENSDTSDLLQPSSSNPDISENSDSSQSDSEESNAYKLVVPEGYTAARIGMTLEEIGVCTTEDFLAATQEGDFSEFPLISGQPENSNRGFKLEGYLFPATYDFTKDQSLDSIIRKMLSTMEQRMNSEIRQKISESGYNTDEIIAMASIIEKEASNGEEMLKISSVLHNRLKAGQKLECDVTVKYCTGVLAHYTDRLEELKYHYNTYRCDALPAGAICNPGIAAINAALSPADTNYYYFVTDKDGNYYYAETYEEHEENCRKAGIEN